MALRIKNKSLIEESIVTKLGNFIVPQNTIVNVPTYFTECQVREAIHYFPNLTLLGGYVLNADDIIDGNLLNHAGVMTKDVYDIDYNNVVDNTEGGGGGGTAPTSLAVDFDHTDFASVFKSIGTALANYTVESVGIDILGAFDTGSISIGDDSDHARLANELSSDITFVGTYDNLDNYKYLTNTYLKIFFHGSPSVGYGRVTIFLS